MKIESGALVFVDTNVLIEATDRRRKLNANAVAVFEKSFASGYHLMIGSQTVREYLVVATRPAEVNGLGLEKGTALENIADFRRYALLVGETVEAAEIFLKFARLYQISGKRLHDLQLIATAFEQGARYLITNNTRDFPKTTSVEILELADLESK